VQELGSGFWLYAVLGGIVGSVGNGFLIKSLEKGELSVLGPVNAYKSVVGIIVGMILLKEVPGLWGILGMALIIYESYFVLDTTEERFSFALLKKQEIQFRIWAMILSSVEAVFVKNVRCRYYDSGLSYHYTFEIKLADWKLFKLVVRHFIVRNNFFFLPVSCRYYMSIGCMQ
jgi:hypothetical protein